VDVIRGVALLLIFLGHATLVSRAAGDVGNVRLYLLIDAQIADASDFFVFLSGYVYGLVYARRLAEGGLRLVAAQTLKRLLQIYAAIIIAFAAALLLPVLLPWTDAEYLRATGLASARADASMELAWLLALVKGPFFLAILVLYVALLAVAPLFLAGMVRAPAVTLGFSALLWGVAQFWSLQDVTRWLNPRDFDPLAWQFLFNLGMFAGTRGLLSRRAKGGLAGAWRSLPGLLAVAVVVAAFAWRMALRLARQNLLDEATAAAILAVPGWDKAALGPLRLANFAALAYLAFAYAPPPGWRPQAWLARGLAAMGEKSLEMFSGGCVALLVAAWAVRALGGGPLAYFPVMAVAGVAYVGAGLVLQAFSRAVAPAKAKAELRAPAVASLVDPGR
jgi:hypothetical protein